MTMDTTARVDAGMMWLNRLYPNHFRTVNLDTLNVASVQFCPLAQAAQSTYGNAIVRHDISADESRSLGFSPSFTLPPSIESDADALTAEWRRRYDIGLAAIYQEIMEHESEARRRD